MYVNAPDAAMMMSTLEVVRAVSLRADQKPEISIARWITKLTKAVYNTAIAASSVIVNIPNRSPAINMTGMPRAHALSRKVVSSTADEAREEARETLPPHPARQHKP